MFFVFLFFSWLIVVSKFVLLIIGKWVSYVSLLIFGVMIFIVFNSLLIMFLFNLFSMLFDEVDSIGFYIMKGWGLDVFWICVYNNNVCLLLVIVLILIVCGVVFLNSICYCWFNVDVYMFFLLSMIELDCMVSCVVSI